METGLLLLRRLGSVFVKKFEQLGSRVLVKSMGELSNSEWDLGTLVEDDFGGSSRRVRSLKFCLIVFNGLLNM